MCLHCLVVAAVLGHLLGLMKKTDREKFNSLLHEGGRLYVLDEIRGLNFSSQEAVIEAWKRADAAALSNGINLIGKVQGLQYGVPAWARFANEKQKQIVDD
ncbi:hypothetical protein VOLCADRAFT_96480 [Volvox carteri f. nagariensis]|uniref:Uncharacterized protein n=1 Tax=Volvox carteri f. nagariensis TaxID=3068 RepID=D8UA81_VOLCA|nr:uncharacterized protein VOLCADRAFT_96480 [Volvox carteri f. nagariensis]EFJ43430.1 hypothetical protein VOLCADRAFT_96480 [Volvox carteri f. nagariensis]|eukprot:XP_002955577.1 hypothetical protein VOLCADRAFT_96480 [Volvox carteri f. nagariensis]